MICLKLQQHQGSRAIMRGQHLQQARGRAGCGETRPTILVVEDEVLIRLMVVDDLTAAGFKVVQASNADEAINQLRSVTDIALVVTDVRGP
jgi:PleD family two-component response regulator